MLCQEANCKQGLIDTGIMLFQNKRIMKMEVSILFISFFAILLSCQEKKDTEMQGDASGIPALRQDSSYDYGSPIHEPEHFGFGKKAPESFIKQLDISIPPDGKGLPKGEGTADKGELTYKIKCVACHGATGVEGPFDHLVSSDTSKARTIGNYWPYATTIFDYIRRAMPFNKPGSLTNEEVYNLTAYLLYRNKIIAKSKIINAESLPEIRMPARNLFVNDDRKGGPDIR